jgi:hypothetical protein
MDESEFYNDKEDIWLIDADVLLSEIKRMVQEELGENSRFTLYIGVNQNDQFEIWVKDSDGRTFPIRGDHSVFDK